MNANERNYNSLIVLLVTIIPFIWEYLAPIVTGLEAQNIFYAFSGFFYSITLGSLHGRKAKKYYLSYPWLCCTMAGCFAMPAGYLLGQDATSMVRSIVGVFLIGLPICIGEFIWEQLKHRI